MTPKDTHIQDIITIFIERGLEYYF